MTELELHKDIYDKLNYFVEIKKIPNIIFHGPSGGGKHVLLNNFIKTIYDNDRENIKSYVMFVNCAHGKGIKFIREELKFFARTNANNNLFKSIILSNADKLTTDGQSALRRCIELFSHSTRFFIIVEDKYKLLKPILSRFCEIYIPLPEINSKLTNLNKYHIENTYNFITETKRTTWLKTKLDKSKTITSVNDLCKLSIKLYEKGYNAVDLMSVIERMNINETKKYKLLLTINKIKKEFRNEKMLMLFILNFLYTDTELSLNEISFI